MGVKIYDSTQQAFVDADAPKVYSTGDSAFVDAGGKLWNSIQQGFEDEAWNATNFLFEYGKMSLKSGGFEVSSPSFLTVNADGSWTLSRQSGGNGYWTACAWTKNTLQIKSGQTLHMLYSANVGSSFNSAGFGISDDSKISDIIISSSTLNDNTNALYASGTQHVCMSSNIPPAGDMQEVSVMAIKDVLLGRICFGVVTNSGTTTATFYKIWLD